MLGEEQRDTDVQPVNMGAHTRHMAQYKTEEEESAAQLLNMSPSERNNHERQTKQHHVIQISNATVRSLGWEISGPDKWCSSKIAY